MGQPSGERALAGRYRRAEGNPPIEYPLELLDEIRAHTVDGFRSLARGGIEVGGVLFGAREGDAVRIAARRAMSCEHAFGPGFQLSANDEAALRELLAAARRDPELAGMEPVGWYHSHTRSGIELTERDLEFHARFFPQTWQVALVLRPENGGHARAAFFTGASPASRGEFELAPMAVLAPEAPPPAPEPPRTQPARAAFMTLDPAAGQKRSPAPVWPWLAAALVFVFVAVALAARFYEPTLEVVAAPPLQLRAADVGGQVLITWDRGAPAISDSAKAVLEIVDGSHRTELELDRDSLTKGSVTYVRQSGRVDVRLSVSGKNGTTEETASFLGDQAGGSEAGGPPRSFATTRE